MHPDEGGGGRRVDGGTVEVATCGGDDASNEETDYDGRRLHDRCAEPLADDDCDENGETETDELGAAPRKRVRRIDIGTKLEETALRSASAVVGASGPVLEARLDEVDADEHDGRTGDQGREYALQDPGWRKGHENFQEGADALCS